MLLAVQQEYLPPPLSRLNAPYAFERHGIGNAHMTTIQTHASLDASLGPLIVGELRVSRVTLAEMGACINGAPVAPVDLGGREADQTLLDSISFPESELKRFLSFKPGLGDSSANLLFELASLRSVQAPPLMQLVPNEALTGDWRKLDNLLGAVQRTNLNQAHYLEGAPPWADVAKSRSLSAAAYGLQLFGYYSAINALVDALKQGDGGQILTAGAELLAELTSSALELALESLGTRMMGNGARLFNAFKISSAGKYLRRGAGLFALALTLPFDISDAVSSLKKAIKSSGKAAMDHYVSAGFSIASASLGVLLGIAALAGFSNTGPLGMAAAVVLMVASQVYSAARQVDDIDDYIELSTRERLRSGWFLFIGETLDKDVQDRYDVAKMSASYAQQLTSQADAWLKGALKGTVQAVVNGVFEVRLSPARHWKYEWDESLGGVPYVDTTALGIHDADDVIDASAMTVGQLPGVVKGQASSDAGVLWRLGGGNDDVKGLAQLPNFFVYGAGRKQLVGGERGDQFLFDIPAGTFAGKAAVTPVSSLHGGEGSDTLHLLNTHPYPEDTQGYAIDLAEGSVKRSATAEQALVLDSIENVSTAAGVVSHVKGSAAANILIAQGENDRLEGLAGDDTLIIQGTYAWVDGGMGRDRYVIASNRGTVTLHEDDWQEDCLVEMRWDAAAIVAWFVQDCSLIIQSMRGHDGELAERVIQIDGLYRRAMGKRVLNANRLRFITADGYTLVPVLAPELSDQDSAAVTVALHGPSDHRSLQNLLYEGTFVVPFGRASHCFITRGPPEKTVRVPLKGDVTACTLYVDYDAQELVHVQAHYHVTCQRVGQFDELTYGQVSLTLGFSDGGRLVVLNYASDRSKPRTNVTSSIMANRLKLDCRFVLILRDGVSYRLDPVPQAYLQDRTEPGSKTFDGRTALRVRLGVYPFLRPLAGKAVQLQSSAQKIVIPMPPHRQDYVLQGRSATYEVITSPAATLHVSTPAALSKTANASCWLVRTEPLEHGEIYLEGSVLTLGSVTLHLPHVTDPDVPLERVTVHTANGDIYEVRQDLALVYPSQLYLGFCASIEAAWAHLQRLRQTLSVMVRTLWVGGVSLAEDEQSAVFYDVLGDRWGLKADPSRVLTHAQLKMRS